jgi:hypothetical protein
VKFTVQKVRQRRAVGAGRSKQIHVDGPGFSPDSAAAPGRLAGAIKAAAVFCNNRQQADLGSATFA